MLEEIWDNQNNLDDKKIVSEKDFIKSLYVLDSKMASPWSFNQKI